MQILVHPGLLTARGKLDIVEAQFLGESGNLSVDNHSVCIYVTLPPEMSRMDTFCYFEIL